MNSPGPALDCSKYIELLGVKVPRPWNLYMEKMGLHSLFLTKFNWYEIEFSFLKGNHF